MDEEEFRRPLTPSLTSTPRAALPSSGIGWRPAPTGDQVLVGEAEHSDDGFSAEELGVVPGMGGGDVLEGEAGLDDNVEDLDDSTVGSRNETSENS